MKSEKEQITLINFSGTIKRSILAMLRYWGYIVHCHERFNSSSLLGANEDPSLVIFQFREYSGSEFDNFRHLRTKWSQTPFIGTSEFASLKSIFKLGQNGANDFILQPIKHQELKNTLEKYIHNGQQPELSTS